MGSRGSVIPFFISLKEKGIFPITDPNMTRFMISLEDAVKLVWHAFEDMISGEIYIKKYHLCLLLILRKQLVLMQNIKLLVFAPVKKYEQMFGIEDANTI